MINPKAIAWELTPFKFEPIVLSPFEAWLIWGDLFSLSDFDSQLESEAVSTALVGDSSPSSNPGGLFGDSLR